MIHNVTTLAAKRHRSANGALTAWALLALTFSATQITGPPSARAGDKKPNPSEETAKRTETAMDAGDPYLWLEEIDGERAMEWVEAQNALMAERLEKGPLFAELLAQAKAALGNTSRIPVFSLRGDYLYELWKDDAHPRGLYRRMKVSDLGADKPSWEPVLDVDALGAAENQTYVLKGMKCLSPEYRHCLASLSPGGGDAVELREFDMKTKSFVEDGFRLPKSKVTTDWIDRNTLYVGADFGPGTMTESGYPRTIREWKRGTSIKEAILVAEVPIESVSVGANHYEGDEGVSDFDLVTDAITFWKRHYYERTGDKLVRLDIPEESSVYDVWRGRLLIEPKTDWTVAGKTYVRGSLVIADPAALRGGEGSIEALFEPTHGVVLEDVSAVDQGILLTLLDQVKGRLQRYEPKEGGGFEARDIEFPDNGSLNVTTVDRKSGDAFVHYESFVTPRTLFHVSGATSKATEIRSQTPTFDGSKIEVHQYWATSKDGTKVPYFAVHKTGLELNGKNPTHIFSYGGFRNALTPSYSGTYEDLYGAYGQMWLERGGVFVLANIRGGGEFGPDWHTAALRENRERSFEDFEAIAGDLATRKITSAQHIGIEGRSNGGLLVTATFTRHPELYGAVICGVPLSDMKRYHLLLAGASWMAEFGDPDVPEDWEFMKRYSPYQNLEAKRDYPAVFYYTSTRDDRVHPGHARKMAAKMIDLGYEVWYYENTEGGHGGSTTNDQLAYRLALAYSHLWNQLK